MKNPDFSSPGNIVMLTPTLRVSNLLDIKGYGDCWLRLCFWSRFQSAGMGEAIIWWAYSKYSCSTPSIHRPAVVYQNLRKKKVTAIRLNSPAYSKRCPLPATLTFLFLSWEALFRFNGSCSWSSEQVRWKWEKNATAPLWLCNIVKRMKYQAPEFRRLGDGIRKCKQIV